MAMKLPEYLIESNTPFSGWNFTYLKSTSRMHEAPLPWNYYLLALKHLYMANTVLDLGTGGGEFFSQFPLQNKRAFATERYAPNVAVAKHKLERLGVQVIGLEKNEDIQLEQNMLDLILCRHEAYQEDEIYALLTKYGVFITQQVGGDNNKEFHSILGSERQQPLLYLEQVEANLKDAGFYIEYSNEVKTYTRFYDIGAVLFYLDALAHQIPITTPNQYELGIREIEAIIDENGYYDVTCHRLIVVAKKSEETLYTKFAIKEHDID